MHEDKLAKIIQFFVSLSRIYTVFKIPAPVSHFLELKSKKKGFEIIRLLHSQFQLQFYALVNSFKAGI